jgi:flagellar export protein FliJ
MPKKPSAQFDALLRVRRMQEDLRAREFALAQHEVLRVEREIADINARQLIAMDDAAKVARKQFDAREVRSYYQYERRLSRIADDKSSEAEQLRTVAEERRRELEHAMKRRRVMEKLIEKKTRVYMAELRKMEQDFADETAVNRSALARTADRRTASVRLALEPEPAFTENEQPL